MGSFWLYLTCIQFPQSNAHRVGVASTNRTDKFWHTGSAEEYSSEEFDGWGIRSYARVWRSYLQSYSEWMLHLIPPMRRCNNLCNSALFVLWYYRCMDVVFDWNLGNTIYNDHNTLRLYGFPFAKIRSFQMAPYLALKETPHGQMTIALLKRSPLSKLTSPPTHRMMKVA